MDSLFYVNVLLGIISLLFLFVQQKFQYWKKRKVPYIEPEFFYGNSRGISKKIHHGEFFRKMYFELKQKGPLVGVYISIRAIAMATDLDLIKNILVKDFNIFPNRGIYFNEVR